MPDNVKMQSVPVGTERKELNLPSTQYFTDHSGKAGTVSGITWQSEPEFDGTLAGEYIFTPRDSRGGYSLESGSNLPQDHLTGDRTVCPSREISSGLTTITEMTLTMGSPRTNQSKALQSTFSGREEGGSHYECQVPPMIRDKGDLFFKNITLKRAAWQYRLSLLYFMDCENITFDNVVIDGDNKGGGFPSHSWIQMYVNDI